MLSDLSICRRPAGERPAGDLAGRPRPLEVEATNPPVDVENLADKEQPGQTPRLHRRGSISVERDAAGGDLGVVVPTGLARPAAATRPARGSSAGGRHGTDSARPDWARCASALEHGVRDAPPACRRPGSICTDVVGLLAAATHPHLLHVVERATGMKFTVSRTSRPSSVRPTPVARGIQHDRPADAEMRPEQRAGQSTRDGAVDPDGDLHLCETPDSSRWTAYGSSSSSSSGASAGIGATIVWPSACAIA